MSACIHNSDYYGISILRDLNSNEGIYAFDINGTYVIQYIGNDGVNYGYRCDGSPASYRIYMLASNLIMRMMSHMLSCDKCRSAHTTYINSIVLRRKSE